MRWLGLVLILTLFGATEAKAQVVALGASGTRGYHLPESEAWPAKLEALLRRHGVNVSVSNQGINGDTTDGMLSRLDSAAPDGTRVVIFDPGGNDYKNKRHPVADHEGNIRTIIDRLRARGVAVVFSGGPESATDAPIAQQAGASWCGRLYQGVPPEDIEDSPDGHHPTPAGHDIIAARMLPCVLQALRHKG
jgi:acyl-CoA thioesterase-1